MDGLEDIISHAKLGSLFAIHVAKQIAETLKYPEERNKLFEEMAGFLPTNKDMESDSGAAFEKKRLLGWILSVCSEQTEEFEGVMLSLAKVYDSQLSLHLADCPRSYRYSQNSSSNIEAVSHCCGGPTA